MSEGFLQYIRGCLDLDDPTVDAMQPLANNSSSCSDLAPCFEQLGDKLHDGRRQDVQGQVICILACHEGVKGSHLERYFSGFIWNFVFSCSLLFEEEYIGSRV